jgi:hypothetical protein
LADFGIGGNGGAGVVVLRYSSAFDRLSDVGAGLTYTVTTAGGYHIYNFTAGSDTIRS